MSARLIATRILQTVIEQRVNLTQALSENKAFQEAGNNRAWIQELCYGTLRWYIQLEYLLSLLLAKPIKKKDSALKYLLLSGLYQLKHMQDPPHAVVSETVDVCHKLKKDSAKGLINAVLRRYLRESKQLQAQVDKHVVYSSAHPEWLIKQLEQDWPDQALQILQANNQRPPMVLRVNRLKISRRDYLEMLADKTITASPTRFSEDGVELETPCAVDKLPGFSHGLVSVQDQAAQLASGLLQLDAKQNVLDACAAPGGKSAHILETTPEIQQLVLVEKEKKRAEKIQEHLQRLNLTAEQKICDLLQLKDWWDGRAFDRILLDAPCSATGVIRRHPDIKLLRKREQVENVRQLQKQLLDTVWKTLKPGGLLVYATCSVLKQENVEIIKQFLETHADSELQHIRADWGIDTGYGRQILPGTANMDGFFYAVLRNVSE